MFFECEYCKKKVKNSKTLEKHLCEAKKKHILLQSKHGQIAFICYENWRRLKGFYAADKATFVTSKYFKSFINFVDFCSKKAIPERNGYIKTMVDKGVEPNLWINDTYYDYYISNFETIYSPIRQVEISLEYMYKLGALFECDLKDVIKKLTMVDLLRLIVVKKLSLWLLLFMKSFKQHIATGITEEEHDLLETVVNPEEWRKKIAADPKSTEKIKALMTSLNI